jgi:hypothetical protein
MNDIYTVMTSCVVDDLVYFMAGSTSSYPPSDYFKRVYIYKSSDHANCTTSVSYTQDKFDNITAGHEYRIFPIPATNTRHIESNKSLNEISAKL